MAGQKSFMSPLTILMLVIVVAAIATWLIPAGKYDTLAYQENKSFLYKTADSEPILPFSQRTLDSLHILIPLEKFSAGSIRKPVSVPGTYKKSASQQQGIIATLKGPVKGIYDSIDIIFFVLLIGAFIQIINESGAMIKGLTSLSYRMKGKEAWLIIILTFLFSFGGSSYGMAEEALAFYPVLIPIFIAAGYDLIVPVAVIFAGTQLGTLSSFTNPFSTIIASNAAGINWTDGLTERIIMFVITTAITIWYIVRYAQKVKKNPTSSLVYKSGGVLTTGAVQLLEKPAPLDNRTKLTLFIFAATFLGMIAGVVFFDWWLLEMSTLFFAASIIAAIVLRLKEPVFIQQFIAGAQGILPVALIIGVARGVTVLLNEGQISDSIIFYAANLVSTMPPALFIVLLLVMFMLFTLFISSSSGMAVLTMPIMGSLALLVNVPGREIVNAYLFGMGIMGFMTPTGLMLPSLALAKVSIKAWWRFIYPLLIILFIVCAFCLVIGIYIK